MSTTKSSIITKIEYNYSFQCFLLFIQSLHLNSNFLCCFFQLNFFGSNNFIHTIIDIHSSDPATETFTGNRHFLDNSWIKIWIIRESRTEDSIKIIIKNIGLMYKAISNKFRNLALNFKFTNLLLLKT